MKLFGHISVTVALIVKFSLLGNFTIRNLIFFPIRYMLHWFIIVIQFFTILIMKFYFTIAETGLKIQENDVKSINITVLWAPNLIIISHVCNHGVSIIRDLYGSWGESLAWDLKISSKYRYIYDKWSNMSRYPLIDPSVHFCCDQIDEKILGCLTSLKHGYELPVLSHVTMRLYRYSPTGTSTVEYSYFEVAY